MPSKSAVVITGIKDIDRRLKTLAPRVQGKVLRPAMRAGLKIVAAEWQQQVAVDTGATKRNVKVRAVKRRKRGSIELEARIAAVPELKRTSGTTGKTVFYPAVQEYGAKDVPPNPAGRRAFEARAEAARQVTITAIRAGVEREASRS